MPEYIEFRDGEIVLGRLVGKTLYIDRLTDRPILGCTCWLCDIGCGNVCFSCRQVRMLGRKILKVVVNPEGCSEEHLEAVKRACRKTDVECCLLEKVEM